MKELRNHIGRKTTVLQAIESRLRGITMLNPRQQALIRHALRHLHRRYTFRSQQMTHNVVYQTARTDLLDLEQRGLLTSRKVGRTWYFTAVPDLEERLARLEGRSVWPTLFEVFSRDEDDVLAFGVFFEVGE